MLKKVLLVGILVVSLSLVACASKEETHVLEYVKSAECMDVNSPSSTLEEYVKENLATDAIEWSVESKGHDLYIVRAHSKLRECSMIIPVEYIKSANATSIKYSEMDFEFDDSVTK